MNRVYFIFYIYFHSLRKAERKIQKQRNALKARSEERKQERQTRNDAIRVKYGKQINTYY
jgi:hypothetical protein